MLLTSYCQDAIDVEASLQHDGAMDIGVFGSRARLEDGRDWIQMIVDILDSVPVQS